MDDFSTVVSTIMAYSEVHFPLAEQGLDTYEFARRSYERWAVGEICDRITDKPWSEPIDIVDWFIIELAFFSNSCGSKPNAFIFQSAIHAAEEIRHLILKGAKHES